MENRKLIFGLESSCDDTAVCLWDYDKSCLVFELKASQVLRHAKFGGVVPEIASREHLNSIADLTSELLSAAKVDLNEIDYFAVTTRPGLIGSLLVGTAFTKALAWSLNKPIIGVDHLEAHMYTVFIDNGPPRYPNLTLLVSGGHTHLYLVNGFKDYELLARTMDDSCGEAFDKVAKLLGLSYPGGSNIEALAKLHRPTSAKNIFTLPLQGTKKQAFSYSGLKTAVRYKLAGLNVNASGSLLPFEQFINIHDQKTITTAAEISWHFQECAIDHLIDRLTLVLKNTTVKYLAVCGGVAGNKRMQAALLMLAQRFDLALLYPQDAYTTDNAAMVAYLAELELKSGCDTSRKLQASAKSILAI